MKEKDFEILMKNVRQSVRKYDRYDYVQRTASVLGHFDYIAGQYPDAVLTVEQVIQLFDLVSKEEEKDDA